ncbi:ExeM/NucH family extracellular endonuclease [Halomonadaceae bacterium KBTZ08]
MTDHWHDVPKRRNRLGLALALVTAPAMLHANPLIISEYLEGSGNNKAIEVANVSDNRVDLASWELQVFFNGNDSPGLTINLKGNVGPGKTHVFASGNATDAVLAQAQQTSNAGLFNGNDAVTLLNGGSPVDRIGQVGFNPGTAWKQDGISTQDATLIRRPESREGDAAIFSAFDPSERFTALPQDTFEDLGRFGDNDSGDDDAPEPGQCGEPATLISGIQGNGDTSPLAGESVRVEAVVSAVMPGLDGFFLEEEAPDRDDDPATSEGLFVFAPDKTVEQGQRIRLAGTASEFFGKTQVNELTDLVQCGSGSLPEPATLTLPVADMKDFESLENQRVRLDQTLTVTDTYNLGRFGEVRLSAGRLFNPTQVAMPGDAAQSVAERNKRSRLVLDDASTAENPETIPYPASGLSANNTLRLGDTTEQVTGVLDFGFDAWRIQPLETPSFLTTNAREPAPIRADDANLRVATFNVLNFFNGNGQGGGFPTARGADTPRELRRQKDKLVSAINAMDADIITLMEIENDGYGDNSAIADLTEALGEDWAFVDPGLDQLGDDAIAVGIIFRDDRVDPVGEAATLASGAFSDRNRQPLAQTFSLSDEDEALTVIVNHFKSKGCGDAEGANADQGDGQGCWNPLRTAAAEAIADWATSGPTGTDEADVLVTGDLNAYAREDPIRALKSAGMTDLVRQSRDTPTYSYVFKGKSGTLDYALANSALEDQVRAARVWHSNADEPRALDYNTEFKTPEQRADLFSTAPWRASDHDPILVDLKLASSVPGDLNGDGRVTGRDLSLLTHALFRGKDDDQFDINGDGHVNVHDLWALIRQF